MLDGIDSFYQEGGPQNETNVFGARFTGSIVGTFTVFFGDVFAFQELYPEGALSNLSEEEIIQKFEQFRNERKFRR